MNRQDKYVIIVAGGKGLRMGGDIPKQFMLLEGRPVLMHTIQAFYGYDSTIRIFLVLPHEQKEYWKNLCVEYDFSVPHQIVLGGETRFHSVKNGLEAIGKILLHRSPFAVHEKIPATNALIGVHDGVRPLVDKELIGNVYAQADSGDAAFPAIPVTDSMRKLADDLQTTVPADRSRYFFVQTPQVFKAGILFEAYRQTYEPRFTDDVSVVETLGICRPVMVEGSRGNIKITAPADLIIAQALWLMVNDFHVTQGYHF
ncbi:MAG: 2-C-methyl-D-erythritol 4-phosphate cytidylyltransferase [Dysgonamonadaceae bacterium]|jgi:2-C-methyl-D-erythritol 4-phosphate cytidylyltransferase|nr:2-C-methyl-D-erythritol 4-phosphate cytidylyltransferase [Dysgonamonadaceae bacterium]